MLEPINSVAQFYAHALAIEHEAATSYRALQAQFADRGEEVLAGLCGNLAHFEQDHYERLLGQARHLELPALPLDKYRWLEARSPARRPTRPCSGSRRRWRARRRSTCSG